MRVTNTHRAAIITKYLGPTNSRGSRIKATKAGDSKVSVTIGYDYALDTFDVHAKAAKALCDKYKWECDLIAGGTESGYVFLMEDQS